MIRLKLILEKANKFLFMISTLKLSGMVLLYIYPQAVTNEHEADGTYKIKDLNSLDNDFEIINI